MLVGIVGKPNVGKSTLFSAMTMANAAIANYPFTTIEPNRGVAFVRSKCPHTDFNIQCTPRNSRCEGGIRLVPVEILDVAGLVPGAHEGKGMGNKFLDDLRQAQVLIHVVDASGGTNADGQIVEPGSHDPVFDIEFLENEIDFWIAGILQKNWERTAKKAEAEGIKIEEVILERLTGLGITLQMATAAIKSSGLEGKPSRWSDDDILRLGRNIRIVSKPIVILANKSEIAPEKCIERIREYSKREGASPVYFCSADIELALKKAAKAGIIDYHLGSIEIKIKDSSTLNQAQKAALSKMEAFLVKNNGTGVQSALEQAVYSFLNMIVVYPVEDETHLTDKEGRVLPDAHLLKRGSTAKDLAFKVHTDLGKHFIRAINARTRRIVGADYQLEDKDVIKIVADV
ncbi:MAG: redox-regulated ATPase YchF [Thermoplasmata archaeon]